MTNDISVLNSNDIIKENYIEYGKYVISTRAYPDIVDGCKAIHRRCIDQVYKECPRHNQKAAAVIGSIVKAHPHPSAIFPVLVSLTQPDGPFPIFDGQGNWGSAQPPTDASAERYVELKISDITCKLFEAFSSNVDMVEGDMNNMEPHRLATYIPLCFLEGSYGIPVGMSTVNIPPLYAPDICDYAIEVLKNNLEYEPDTLIKPNLGLVQINSSKKEWKQVLTKGLGKIKISPRIVMLTDKKLEITAMPDGKTITNVFKILQPELEKDQIDVRNETTNKLSIIIEVLPYKKVNIETLAKRLMDKLMVNESYRFIFADDGVAVHTGFNGCMKYCLEYLIKCSTNWAQETLSGLQFKVRILEVIEELKRDGNVSKLPKMDKQEAISFLTNTYNILETQAISVLSKPLSYLTKEHLSEIQSLNAEVSHMREINKDIKGYLITQYTELKKDILQLIKNKPATTFLTKASSAYKLI